MANIQSIVQQSHKRIFLERIKDIKSHSVYMEYFTLLGIVQIFVKIFMPTKKKWLHFWIDYTMLQQTNKKLFFMLDFLGRLLKQCFKQFYFGIIYASFSFFIYEYFTFICQVLSMLMYTSDVRYFTYIWDIKALVIIRIRKI